jgi:hypothetical protein
VAVIWVTGQRRDVGDELAKARMPQGDVAMLTLHTGLIGLVCLSLADAFHLGCMQAVNLAAVLVAVLRQHALGQFVAHKAQLGMSQFFDREKKVVDACVACTAHLDSSEILEYMLLTISKKRNGALRKQ